MSTARLRSLGFVALIAVVLPAPADASAPAGQYVVTGGVSVYDTRTKLTWQQVGPVKTYNWEDAKAYCAGVGATLGGTGWRLPTLKELMTITDHTVFNPAIDATAFPGTPAALFWTSSPNHGSTTIAWCVYFASGDPYPDCTLTTPYRVRCVR